MDALTFWTVLLAAGLTARLTRLVMVDDVGLWFIRGPLASWAVRHTPKQGGVQWGWRMMLTSGLACPFCVGFWIGAGVLGSLALLGGFDSHTGGATVWRWVAGVFTLNYVVAHIGSRLDSEPSDISEHDD